MDYAKMIDHTLLKPEATKEQVKNLCEEAVQYGFHSVCVNSSFVYYCAELLKDSDVKVCTVIGFPLGAMSTAGKAAEAQAAVADGAEELDMVIHVGMIKSGDWDYVKQDIASVVEAAGDKAVVKVILETCLLTDEEKRKACMICKEAGASFVKTSTGFSNGGATVKDVALMREAVGSDMGVKASGGIRSFQDARAMVEAGADRIGASSGIAIIREQKEGERKA
ncbi:MAG TPA: deoxyribose-phosphate aldolase [Candidatus Mediterraneibacter stercoravium]|uniref:Deoxyribose-phosphate aldolase n=1 Tax=Candidatus Mediterraneibacter stercoravium TaxID=2838685 RepID=A0A9D2G6Y1_9FIRM|nr:deoxyribose-phosphate aldolase [Candidatus Mediterraneibacter stercoravium]